jgi:DeoR family suf operon transcriptional repressor
MAQDDDESLFGTTRGKLLLLLCGGPRTVNELAEQLDITDNAVRAQLASLQEGALVRQVGLRPGTRKPHVDYELTPKARRSFPQAHEPVLGTLVDVLHERLDPEQTRSVMKEVARRLFATWIGELRERKPERRAGELLRKVQDVAPGVSLEEERDHFRLRACGCPLASVTASHPAVCDLLAEILGDVLGTPVRDRCDRTESPRCCFEVAKATAR